MSGSHAFIRRSIHFILGLRAARGSCAELGLGSSDGLCADPGCPTTDGLRADRALPPASGSRRSSSTHPPRWVCAFLLPVLMAGFALTLRAQVHEDGAPADPPMEKVRARMQWKYDRVTWPGGDIPEGARARATQQVRANMRLYAPGGASRTQAAPVWKNVGPFNIGGRILSIAVNPRNSRVIFIGAADGGVWKSLDGGANWRSVSEDFPTQAMGAIAIDPVDTSVVYAGTGEANFSTGRMFDGGGMMKSTDGGETWTEIGGGSLPPYSRASAIVVNPNNHAIVHAAIPDGMRDAARAGIYSSTDAGATWTLSISGRMSDLVMDPANPDILYTHSSKVFDGASAATYGMLKTTDGGATWAKLPVAGLVDSTMGRTSIALCASRPEVLYIGVSEVVGDGRTWLMGVFRSTDAGATWSQLTVPFDYMVSQGWYDNIIGVDPTNPDIVFAGGVKLIRSGDGGATWTRIPDQGYGGNVHVDQHAIAFDPADHDRVFIGNDGGFFIGTVDGTQWVKRDLGLSITQFVGGAMHPTNDNFLLGGTQDNGTMISSMPPMWDHVLYGDGGNGAINPLKPNILYSTKENLKLWRSDDGGHSWTEAMGGLPPEGSLFYIDYAMDMRNPSTLYLGTYRLYKTTDDGRSWRNLVNCPFTSASGGCYYITAVSVASWNSDVVLAAAPGQVGISTDAGATWRYSRDQLPLAYVSSVHSFAPDTLLATILRYGEPKVWASTDFGTTWRDITGDLPDVPVNDIIGLDGKLIVASDIGTFISDNFGASWQRLGSGMPALSVQKLRYNERTGTLRAMTHGRGMYDLEWKTTPLRGPSFASQPATDPIRTGQPFLYAPVVDANPTATFTLGAGSNGTIDPVLGTVQWTASGSYGDFEIIATNASGSTSQKFRIPVVDAPVEDWRMVSATAFSSPVTVLHRAADGTLWAGRDSGFVARSVDDGATWLEMQLPGMAAAVAGIHAFDARNVVLGTRDARILTTSDGGTTWIERMHRTDGRFGNFYFWNALEGMAISTGARDSADIYLTADGGATWQLSTDPRPFARLPLDNTLSFFDRDHGWFASSNLGASPMEEATVLRTTDGGRTWQTRVTGTRGVSSMIFTTAMRGYLVDETQGRVRRTQTAGAAWSTTFYPMNGLRNVHVWGCPGSRSLWIVSDTSAWVTDNDGSTWTRTQMVPSGSIKTAVFADSVHGWAISANGLVQTLLRNPLVSVSTAPPVQPLRLTSVWPNPVTAQDAAASIQFSLDAPAHITLRVYNSAGREVAFVADAMLPAGDHMSVWNAGDVPNGVYFVTLETGTTRHTARIVLAR